MSTQCEVVVHKSKKKICTLHVKKEKCCPAITNYWQNEVVTNVVMLLATYKIRVVMIMKFQEIGMIYNTYPNCNFIRRPRWIRMLKPSQNKKGQKKLASFFEKNYSATSCKKVFKKRCSWKFFWPSFSFDSS